MLSPKKLLDQKFYGPKHFRVKYYSWPKLVLGPKKFGSRKNSRVKTFGSKRNLSQKKNLGKKKILVKKHFGPQKKFLVQNKFWVQNQNYTA